MIAALYEASALLHSVIMSILKFVYSFHFDRASVF